MSSFIRQLALLPAQVSAATEPTVVELERHMQALIAISLRIDLLNSQLPVVITIVTSSITAASAGQKLYFTVRVSLDAMLTEISLSGSIAHSLNGVTAGSPVACNTTLQNITPTELLETPLTMSSVSLLLNNSILVPADNTNYPTGISRRAVSAVVGPYNYRDGTGVVSQVPSTMGIAGALTTYTASFALVGPVTPTTIRLRAVFHR